MLGYLGPEGTFSHQAAIEWADGKEELKEYPTIASAIHAAERGEIDHCIVPIENSLNGSVTMTLDTLAFDVDMYIAAEHKLAIEQNLMIKKGSDISDIKTIVSHPQALGQCSKLLEEKFRDVELKAVSSTAMAARMAAESDGTIASISTKAAASEYGLEIIFPACNDDVNNFTRFVVLENKRALNVTDHDKTSIVFSTEHKPGALANAIALLAREKINICKIESRPMKKEPGKYVFFIDIEGNADDARIYFALDQVRRNSLFYKFLGSYHYE